MTYLYGSVFPVLDLVLDEHVDVMSRERETFLAHLLLYDSFDGILNLAWGSAVDLNIIRYQCLWK